MHAHKARGLESDSDQVQSEAWLKGCHNLKSKAKFNACSAVLSHWLLATRWRLILIAKLDITLIDTDSALAAILQLALASSLPCIEMYAGYYSNRHFFTLESEL